MNSVEFITTGLFFHKGTPLIIKETQQSKVCCSQAQIPASKEPNKRPKEPKVLVCASMAFNHESLFARRSMSFYIIMARVPVATQMTQLES